MYSKGGTPEGSGVRVSPGESSKSSGNKKTFREKC